MPTGNKAFLTQYYRATISHWMVCVLGSTVTSHGGVSHHAARKTRPTSMRGSNNARYSLQSPCQFVCVQKQARIYFLDCKYVSLLHIRIPKMSQPDAAGAVRAPRSLVQTILWTATIALGGVLTITVVSLVSHPDNTLYNYFFSIWASLQ